MKRTSTLSRKSLSRMRLSCAIAAAAAALAPARPGYAAVTGTWQLAGGGSWNTAVDWAPAIPNANTDTATFTTTAGGAPVSFTGGTVTLDAPITVKGITNATTSALTLTNGTGGSLTFAADSGTPFLTQTGANTNSIPVSFGTGGTLTVLGNQGLTITLGTAATQLRTNGTVDYSGFSGAFTMAQGRIDPQATTALLNLPNSQLVLGTTGNAGAGMNGGGTPRNITVGSLAGNAGSYIENSNTSGFATLTIGNASFSPDGNFQGTIGRNTIGTGASPTPDGSTTFRSNINIVKAGSGTETISGTSYAGGTTTINGGTYLMNGTHIATVTTTGNAAATTGTGGQYVVKAGATLGGTGSIKGFDTAGGGVIVDVTANAILKPGAANPDANADGAVDAGNTLTLDQTASAKSVLDFETGGTGSFALGAGLTSTKVAFVGSASVTEAFFNNTQLNFTDLTGGGLATGAYTLFSGDANTNYGGLTKSGDGTITAGLTVGSGLSGYSTSLQQVGNNIVLNVSSASVPEPAALGLIGGLAGLLLLRRRSRA